MTNPTKAPALNEQAFRNAYRGYGRALRREDDPPLAGEPWMSMDDAARLSAELVASARTALAASHGQERWQPIETAPKDGTWILAWLGGIADIADTIQWNYGGWWNGSNGHVATAAQPTHWRPLPTPPTEGPADE
jgi:hypothetical protein